MPEADTSCETVFLLPRLLSAHLHGPVALVMKVDNAVSTS